MQRRTISDAVRGEIITRAWEGETFARIARDLGVSPYQVGRIAMREGGFPGRAELIRLQGDAICAAYEESGSMAAGCEAVRALETGRLEHAARARSSEAKAEAKVAVPSLTRTVLAAWLVADPRVYIPRRGACARRSRSRRTRRRFRMSWPCLSLRHGRRSGDADPAIKAVAGSDPSSRHASIGIGENRDVHRHPPLRRGSLPASSPMREGQNNESRSVLVPVMRGAAEQPPGQRVHRRPDAALDTLPGRIDVAGATPGMRGERVNARSPLCRTEPSARGVAPATVTSGPFGNGRAGRRDARRYRVMRISAKAGVSRGRAEV